MMWRGSKRGIYNVDIFVAARLLAETQARKRDHYMVARDARMLVFEGCLDLEYKISQSISSPRPQVRLGVGVLTGNLRELQSTLWSLTEGEDRADAEMQTQAFRDDDRLLADFQRGSGEGFGDAMSKLVIHASNLSKLAVSATAIQARNSRLARRAAVRLKIQAVQNMASLRAEHEGQHAIYSHPSDGEQVVQVLNFYGEFELPFIPSKKFTGQRKGYVFGMGLRGMGYYNGKSDLQEKDKVTPESTKYDLGPAEINSVTNVGCSVRRVSDSGVLFTLFSRLNMDASAVTAALLKENNSPSSPPIRAVTSLATDVEVGQEMMYTHSDGVIELVRVEKIHSDGDGGGLTIWVPSVGRTRDTVRERLRSVDAPEPQYDPVQKAGPKLICSSILVLLAVVAMAAFVASLALFEYAAEPIKVDSLDLVPLKPSSLFFFCLVEWGGELDPLTQLCTISTWWSWIVVNRIICFLTLCARRLRLFNGNRVLDSASLRSDNDVVIISGRSEIDCAVKRAKYKRSKANKKSNALSWLHWAIMLFTLLVFGLANAWTEPFVSFNLHESCTNGGSWGLGWSSAGLIDMVGVGNVSLTSFETKYGVASGFNEFSMEGSGFAFTRTSAVLMPVLSLQ